MNNNQIENMIHDIEDDFNNNNNNNNNNVNDNIRNIPINNMVLDMITGIHAEDLSFFYNNNIHTAVQLLGKFLLFDCNADAMYRWLSTNQIMHNRDKHDVINFLLAWTAYHL